MTRPVENFPTVGDDPRPLVRAALFFFVWVPAALFVLGLASCILGVGGAIVGFLWGPIVALFVVYAIRRNQTVQRQRRAMTILFYVENAVRLNLPLDRFLQAAELSEFGRTRYLLMRVRQMLLRGYPVGTALEAALPELPQRVARAATAAEQVGRLQPALARLVEQTRRERPSLRDENQPYYRFYLFFLLFIVFFIVTGLMIFVIPKFRDIFKDFHTPLPPMTQLLMNVADWVANEYGWVLLLPFVFLLIYFIARELQRVFMPGLVPVLFPQLREWIAWRLPILSALQRDHALTDVFEHLADAIRAGLPLPDALQGAFALQMNYHMRERLMAWRENLLAGMTPAAAARKARLPELLAGFLDSAESPRTGGNRGIADIFDFLARYYRDRFSRLLVATRAAAEPFAVLAVGSLVGFIVYSVFLPIVTLLNSVEAAGGGVTGHGVL
ncbi:MAG: type II secretion system F family protein [Phycisphaerae bacterium]